MPMSNDPQKYVLEEPRDNAGGKGSWQRGVWIRVLEPLMSEELRGKWVKLGIYNHWVVGTLNRAAKHSRAKTLPAGTVRIPPEGLFRFISRSVDAEGNRAPQNKRWLYGCWIPDEEKDQGKEQ